jgi:ABC-type transport system involved in multi-copper enzyme maturation permease subunit
MIRRILDMFPDFRYYEKDIPEILQLNWVHLVFLVLYSVLFFLAAYLSFLKYDVR